MNNENQNNLNNSNNNMGTNPVNNNQILNGINPMDQVIVPNSNENLGGQNINPTMANPNLNNGVVNGVNQMGLNSVNPIPAEPLNQPMPTNIPLQNEVPNVTPINQNNNAYTATANNGMVNPGVNPAMQSNQNMNPGINSTPNSMNLGVNPTVGFDNPNNIGTIPPVNNNPEANKPKGKKKMNKTLFIVLILVLLLAVGGAVYWYLNLPKTPAISITTKDVIYELNDEISTKVEDYATISGTNASNCILDTGSVDTSKVGEYKYVVKCGTVEKEGKITVGDTKAPVVSLVTVYKELNSEVTPLDFIGVCSANTQCKYEFEDTEIASSLTSEVGEKKVNIVVSDESNNEVKLEGKLIVLDSKIRAYYECESKEQNLEDLNATMTLTHTLGILDTTAVDGGLAFGGFGTQKIVYTFTDAEQFDNLYKEFKQNDKVKINNVEGVALFDKENMKITMISDVDLTSLKTQYGEDKFVSYKTLKPLYETTLGYTCKSK